MHPTSFLVDDRLAIDAGAITTSLTIDEQAQVDHVFLTHSHFDHLATLPFLVDNVYSVTEKPIRVAGPPSTIRSLRDHLFNDEIWPDFSKISNQRTELIRFGPLLLGQVETVHQLEVTPFAMEHTVECYGYIVRSGGAAVAICGDTCSIAGLERILPDFPDLKAVILEASFPRSRARTAEISKHLSTTTFAVEAARLPERVKILVTHLKPEFHAKIMEEIADLNMSQVFLLDAEREYIF